MDAERSWGPDTISILFSATKGISALCVALLRDRRVQLSQLQVTLCHLSTLNLTNRSLLFPHCSEIGGVLIRYDFPFAEACLIMIRWCPNSGLNLDRRERKI